MTSRILVYAQNAISIISDIEKEWTNRNLSVCKTADFEDVIRELRYHNYLLIVVSLSIVLGNTVSAKIIKRKKNYIIAELISIDTPSPHRVAPNCSHASTCGGCAFQHTDYTTQLTLKQRRVHSVMSKIAGIEAQTLSHILTPIVPSPKITNYRLRGRFFYGRGAKHQPNNFDAAPDFDMTSSDCTLSCNTENSLTQSPENDPKTSAFYMVDKWNRFFPVKECMLMDLQINKALQVFNEQIIKDINTTDTHGLSVQYNPSLSEKIDNVYILKTSQNEIMLRIAESSDNLDASASATATSPATSPATAPTKAIELESSEHIYHNFLGCTIRTQMDGFFQVNHPVAEKMMSAVIDMASALASRLDKNMHILELFCGAGAITIPLHEEYPTAI